MKKKGKIYYIVNVFTAITSIILLLIYINNNINVINITFSELIVYLIFFIGLNIVKYVRQYIIFLEEKIPLKRYTKLYIKTTLVNIILPFKLGDLFKMYCFGKEIGNYKKGIIGTLLDRFVDTIVLLIFLVPIELIKIGALSFITKLLITFVAVIIIFIVAVPNTYKYLNKFFIVNKPSKLSLYILKQLEEVNEFYEYGLQLFKGRVYLLAIMSIVSWSIDFYLIKTISTFKLNIFDISTFIEYLTSAVYQPNNIVLMHYYIIAAITFTIINFGIYGIQYIKKLGGTK